MQQSTIGNKRQAALLTNVVALSEAAEALRMLGPDEDRLGMFYGPSGYGKSTAAAVVAIDTNAVLVQMLHSWTTRDLLEAIATEIGVPFERRLGKMSQAICAYFAASQRLLIVDEADILLKKGQLEIIRELHMGSRGVVIMIGEERFAHDIKRIERIAGRVKKPIPAEPATLNDCRLLAEMFCKRVPVADDLLQHLRIVAHGRVRRIKDNLVETIEPAAIKEGAEVATLDWWDGRKLNTGEPPARVSAL